MKPIIFAFLLILAAHMTGAKNLSPRSGTPSVPIPKDTVTAQADKSVPNSAVESTETWYNKENIIAVAVGVVVFVPYLYTIPFGDYLAWLRGLPAQLGNAILAGDRLAAHHAMGQVLQGLPSDLTIFLTYGCMRVGQFLGNYCFGGQYMTEVAAVLTLLDFHYTCKAKVAWNVVIFKAFILYLFVGAFWRLSDSFGGLVAYTTMIFFDVSIHKKGLAT